MPIYVFRCERCKQTEDRFYQSFKHMCQEQAVRCIADGSRMERIPSGPAFTVEGFNAKNGYAK
jgi:predicted nucleic acid-binding Zn ribbon protein